MDVGKIGTGVVVKKDGSVPFDDGVHPDLKTHILGWLAEQGHELFVHPNTGQHTIRGWESGMPLHKHELDAYKARKAAAPKVP